MDNSMFYDHDPRVNGEKNVCVIKTHGKGMKMYMPMMELHIINCLPLLLVILAVEAYEGNSNATDASRAPRSSRRVVRLYSGRRPDPIICNGEGFQADPSNCVVFYRCMKSGRGKYMTYKFQCAPGTIYDPDAEICNHPSTVKRSNCGIEPNISENDQVHDNAIEEVRNEFPLPITTKILPFYTKITGSSRIYTWPTSPKRQDLSTSYPLLISTAEHKRFNSSAFKELVVTSTRKQRSTTPKILPIPRKPTAQNGDLCIFEGFMGDSENCRKFYRCISNLRGGFIRYEFMCTESTIWDDDIQSCNHAWAVKRRRCGRGNINEVSDVEIDEHKNSPYTNDKVIPNNLEQNFIVSQTQKTFDVTKNPVTTTLRPNPTTPSYLMDISYTHSYETKHSISDECFESGFLGDRNDCKKFYRCVDNGRGSYTKYQFSCGEGTVWDANLEACNHAWAVKGCGVKNSTEHPGTTSTSIATETPTKSTPIYEATLQTSTIDNDDVGYGNQNPTTTKLPSSTADIQATKQPSSDCTSSGFIGDETDCKLFYRCVDNGDGTFTKFQFTCGEGTVWDSDLEACNHVWAVKTCGSKGTTKAPIQGVGTTTTSNVITITSTQHAQSSLPTAQTTTDEDENAGYGNPNQETSSMSTTLQSTNTTPIPGKSESNCTSSGFMGDETDCKKFYRCVDKGDGDYNRYEFTCGEGTVWDPKIEACNHPWAVEKCGGTFSSTTEKIESSSITDTNTAQSVTQNDESDSGYGMQQDEISSSQLDTLSSSPASITTTTEQQNSYNDCTSNGFFGNHMDCKKFYRCVENGNGSFTRYEFSCGEGTVWDSKIQSCNHAWAVENCNENQNNEIHKEDGITSNGTTTFNPSSSTTSYNNETDIEQPASQSTTSKPSEENGVTTIDYCKVSGFIGDTQNCKKFYRCVDNGNGGFTRYEFICGEGTVWNQEIQACDHENGLSCNENGESVTKEPHNDEIYFDNNTTKEPTTSDSSVSENKPTPSQNNNVCQNEGFYGDPNDCKKFYRCVDNGKGSFTKFDFTCGDGTVWDQEIQACNHELNSKCFKNSTVSVSESTPFTTFTTTTMSVYTEETENQSSITDSQNDTCPSEGFYPNSADCQKFYRCVSNEKGGFTKYDFTCGDGTMWVQDIQACDHKDHDYKCQNNAPTTKPEQSSNQSTTTEYQSPFVPSSTLADSTEKPHDEYQDNSSNTPTQDDICSSEGFYPNRKDCKKFYRCVDNGQGSYTKYDFTCGEGTAWDTDIQTCNHISEVPRCYTNMSENTQSQTIEDEGVSQTTDSSDSTQKPMVSESTSLSSNDLCEAEGYFGNKQDCTKFYRCVDNGKGGFTKYDFDCGEGTIWDQDVTTCNHPQDVVNPSCQNYQSETSSAFPPTTQFSNTNDANEQTTNCSQQSTTKKPKNENVTCEKAGYYANPNDCKKFYRCVDWDGNGERFSVYHFECGEGTIWDPQLDTCNHEDSVYPPRDCSGVQSQNENNLQENSTEETSSQQTTESTTQDSTTYGQTSTTKKSTTEETTTQQSTTMEATTTVGTTTTQSSSTESSTTQQSSTSDGTAITTTTTEGTTTTQQSTTIEQSTTEITSTQETTTADKTTSQEMTTTESTTTIQTSTTEGKTDESTTTTEQSTTDESTTQQLTESSVTTEGSTDDQLSTTESMSSTEQTEDGSTTESTSTEGTSSKECPDTDEDQYLYVCPTSFRRHPKYCNMFYQCTDDDNHEPKIAVFTCPNNTIYDENKTQCVEESRAEKKCDGEIAHSRRIKRLDTYYKEPIVVGKEKHSCSLAGYYPFEISSECSPAFLKCTQKGKSGPLRGFVYLCPEGYVYWNISKRCERKESMKDCKTSDTDWNKRWEIPVERKNLAF
ncbi:mucin-22-like [Amyelois transitella]|uniref:mucin-22-like n=1 Tax=Amyelois transitella TaxID=680683 RepID=UPI00298FA9F1|nr:mucin-22-like [Amyelois transitella]